VTVGLTFTVLRALPIRNVVIQFTLAVANDEVLTANLNLLDVACKCCDGCRVRLVLSSVGRRKPSPGLALDQLGVIRRDILGNLRQREVSWHSMQQELAVSFFDLHLLIFTVIGEGIFDDVRVILVDHIRLGVTGGEDDVAADCNLYMDKCWHEDIFVVDD
jgi:hypothetical protein